MFIKHDKPARHPVDRSLREGRKADLGGRGLPDAAMGDRCHRNCYHEARCRAGNEKHQWAVWMTALRRILS